MGEKKRFNFNILEIVILFFVLMIGLYLRIYHIGDFSNFFHDQGRHALVVKRIIVDHKLTLLGPQTTAPGVYLGPFYYYLMIIPLWLFKLNPIGIDLTVCFFGISAIVMIYLLTKKITNWQIATITSLIYATNPTVIAFSNHAWNPNLLPFFMLLTIYGIYQVFEEKKDKFWYLIFIGMACSLQLHLFSIILIPMIIGTFIIKKYSIKNFKFFNSSSFLFIVLLFPMFLFELRHHFSNTKNIFKFFLSREINFSLSEMLVRVRQMVDWLMSLMLINRGFIYLLIFLILLVTIKNLKKFYIKLLVLWLFLGFLVIGLYKGIFQYYHGLFLTPIPFLFFGFLLHKFWSNQFLKLISVIFCFYLVFLNVKNFNFQRKDSRLTTLKAVANIIAADVKEKKFNLAGLTWRFDHNAMDYRYFTELAGKRALGLEEYQDAEILYVIDEQNSQDILKSKIMEISEFKPRKVVKGWQIDKKIKILKLLK